MADEKLSKRRPFGAVRTLPSGQFQASYTLDGARVNAPLTYRNVTDADLWLATVRTDIVRGAIKATPKTTPLLDAYAGKWIAQRKDLKATTRELYTGDYRRYLSPYLGDKSLAAITPPLVRDWNYTLGLDLAEAQGEREHHSPATRQTGQASTARAYRLLGTILATAVKDGLILANPCTITGAGRAPASERPTLSLAEVAALAEAVPGHYRAVVLIAAFVGLRIGEIAALRPSDLRLGKRPAVSVSRRAYQLDSGVIDYDVPKSKAGVRTVALPATVAVAVAEHLATYREGIGEDELVFVTARGRSIRGGGYSQAIPKAMAAIGRPDVRVHDLRHTGSTLAAQSGASLPELMNRLGHDSVSAAQGYLHATTDHGREVADALGEAIAAGEKSRAKAAKKAAKRARKQSEGLADVVVLAQRRGAG